VVIALAAMSTAVVLVVSGALDESTRVDIDTAPGSTVVENSTIPAQDGVLRTYLHAFDTWNVCVASQPATAASGVVSSACGTAPQQADDPLLNSYLAAVLDWNKCAAPRLRRGGIDQAVIACGPQPPSPLGG
jgi:hypothetical protein